MNINKLEAQLIKHEGMMLKPYKCTAGKTTIGVGRNLDDNGISRVEALMLLNHDIKQTLSDLYKVFYDFNLYPENVQLVLADMMFNLGYTRFNSFKKMVQAVKDQDYTKAAEEMKDSNWFNQVGDRGHNLYDIMLEEI